MTQEPAPRGGLRTYLLCVRLGFGLPCRVRLAHALLDEITALQKVNGRVLVGGLRLARRLARRVARVLLGCVRRDSRGENRRRDRNTGPEFHQHLLLGSLQTISAPASRFRSFS